MYLASATHISPIFLILLCPGCENCKIKRFMLSKDQILPTMTKQIRGLEFSSYEFENVYRNSTFELLF